MIKKIIHIDDFFIDDVEQIRQSVTNLQFVESQFGYEIPNFNLVLPELEPTFTEILNETVTIDEDRSGVFRKPQGFIHFEGFDSVNDWCLAIAIEETTFNVFEHKHGAKTALDEYILGYRDLFQWDLKTNIILKQNNCLFFRPWLFHSFLGGMIQMYYLKGRT